MSIKGKGRSYRVIDFHTHEWNNGNEAFPNSSAEGTERQHSPRSISSAECLVREMDSTGIDGALIGQPISHRFDHSFKGMCLLNPSQTPEEACKWLEELKGQGFVGVSFNPYLWEGKRMVDKVARAVFCHAGKLNMAVEFICVNGLKSFVDDICTLLSDSPDTQAVIDSFAFCQDKESWMLLQSLSLYNSLCVKLTGFYYDNNVSKEEKKPSPYLDIKKRVGDLLISYGSKCDYIGAISALKKMGMSSEDFSLIVGGNCERIFGAWGKCR